ncbi:MAG: TonB-dependent receptor [Pseudomonadota bacterium]
MKIKLPFVFHLKPAHALAALAGATLLQTAALAQEEEDTELEEIVVTGSRIARDANLTGPLPVQTLTAEDIQASGEFNISDVVNDVPALLASATAEQQDSPFNDGADGANVLNLRALGANRTLVLVNGRRHVGGIQGQNAVDVGSIPIKLVERVEVLTGGASAIYGADAVSGVVNFITKDNFDGFEIDANFGISSEGDGEQLSLSAIWGTNFANDRGNFAVAVDYRTDEGVRASERDNFGLVGSGRDWLNPDLRFQQGDIGGDTPNLAQFFNFQNTGLTNFGLPIPTRADFIADYNAEFGVDPTLTSAENALFDRAANAPQRAVLPGRTFPFTSGYGYIIPGNPFTFDGFDPDTPIDLDGNGVNDCLDSFTGYNSVFGAASFGVVGGCWNVTAAGTYRPVQDGLVSDDFQGFGGDSFNTIANDQTSILIPDDKITVNLLASYDLTESITAFAEAKYVTQETEQNIDPNSFWDLLFGAPDNPFLPAFIQPTAAATGGVAITIDPIGFGDSRKTERETTRFVAGLEGQLDNNWSWEVAVNIGRFDQEISRPRSVINDRFFAAIDAVTDPVTGQPACRSSVDPTAPALTTPFNIPVYDPGYFSFTPGDGQCVPLNIWSGQAGFTPEAIAFVTVPTRDDLTIDQRVLTGTLVGDSEDFFSLPGGPIGFAVGFEYREEESDASFDDFQRGIIPAGGVAPGQLLNTVSANESLTFRPALSVINESGDFDATDVFVEVSLPLITDYPAIEALVVDLAIRGSDYSTIGTATTWKANVSYSPDPSIAFRGGYSEAVRAPNITELFGPQVGTTFRPVDPCDINQINAIGADNPTLAANTQANCEADFAAIGIDPTDGMGNYVFTDPLSAAFGGTTGGNTELDEETAETKTLGVVFQPEDIPGFNLTIDYWDISIDDAIEAVTSQNIVDGCYQGASLNQNFCQLFTRNPDPNSLQAGGFNFLQQTSVNFARLDTSGYDIAARFGFDVGDNQFDVRVQATKVNELDFFQNPNDLSEVNPELGEVNRPEWAGNIFLGYEIGNLSLGWQAQYLDEQLVQFVEVETAASLYGDSVIQDETWIHDFSANYTINEQLMIYGGIRNVTDEEPFLTNVAYPASSRGRFFFVGVDYQL